eukprot:NODE_6833_length_604_cov_3.891892_g5846_i0.p1 GENE.NODE_6833_length_604_cov_3.891892_g5846_i0~~NODE_6833_length_604_cov_3.891892_g5846_i0.p1  ORF type:complete len:123 (-),score=16.15 NODE_6833_length_604_cov_3.891892_g5846_i0:33-401(-)
MIDGTFRVVREGFCLLILATADAAHQCLPIAVAVASGERAEAAEALVELVQQHMEGTGRRWTPKYGLSDHSPVLTASLRKLGCDRLATCMFHVKQMVRRAYPLLGQRAHAIVRRDVHTILWS